LLVHPGIEELFALHRADALASGRDTAHVELAERLRKEWSESGELNPPLLLTGHDLLARGLEQGPIFKRLLDAVREAQLEGTVRTPAEAHALVDRLLAEAVEPRAVRAGCPYVSPPAQARRAREGPRQRAGLRGRLLGALTRAGRRRLPMRRKRGLRFKNGLPRGGLGQ